MPENIFLNINADTILIIEALESGAVILRYKECWRTSLALLGPLAVQ